MKCIQCIKEGKKSKVFIGTTTSTLVYAQPYYDEDGNFVQPPDPNTHTTEYSCSNGHKWTTKE